MPMHLASENHLKNASVITKNQNLENLCLVFSQTGVTLKCLQLNEEQFVDNKCDWLAPKTGLSCGG